MNKAIKNTIIIAIFVGIFATIKILGWDQYLTLEALKSNLDNLKALVAKDHLLYTSAYLAIYIISTAISLPGATILTLAGGAIFGLVEGLILVSFASSIGATLAFLAARYLLRDSFQNKFGASLKTFNEGIKKDGAMYLFTLRLIPAFPFFLINVVMGLTPIKTITFYIVSQIGMLAGTAVYVNAGTQLAQLNSLSGILSPNVIGSFVLLGIFPFIAKGFIGLIKRRKVYKGHKKPNKFDYNVIAIGAGAAGLVTSYIAAAVKAKVALVEKHKMGGDCLNTGCVPSKALIKSAKVYHYKERAKDFGLGKADFDLNFSEVMERIQNIIKKIEPHDSIERYTDLGVECITGEAFIRSPWEVVVGDKILTTKNIVIATGARPFVPPIPGLDKVQYYTSDNLWEMREKPERLLILGGGPIGCEMAQSFARLGCKVTQVERAKNIMGREDKEVCDFIYERFKSEGIDVRLNTNAVGFDKDEQGQYVEVEFAGANEKIYFDKAILAIGRQANTKGFGLQELGVNIGSRGTVEVDQYLRTNFPNIYACGDVAGPYQFTHTAAHQAWFCAVNALFSPFKKFKVDYKVIPWVTYTDPEVAHVGLNEKEATEQNIPYEVYTYGIDDLDRAITESEDIGFVKVLLKPGTDKIIGVTIMGMVAGELLAEYVLAMKHNLGLNKILGTIHSYPTMAEANKYAAGIWKNATKPEKALGYLKKFHSLRR